MSEDCLSSAFHGFSTGAECAERMKHTNSVSDKTVMIKIRI